MNEKDKAPTTPKKKIKRLCKYSKNWEVIHSWMKQEEHSVDCARCVFCNVVFSVANKGYSAVKCHEESARHKSKCKAQPSPTVNDMLTIRRTSPELLLVTAAEITHIYHAIKHNHSYNSLDCSLKLISKMHNDSKICSKISCGRTKCEAIVTEVLGPRELEIVSQSIKSNDLFFSLQMGVSSTKNVQLFPICIQYFTREDGLKTKLVNFFENCSDDEESVADAMLVTLSKMILELGLDFKKVSAFSIDKNLGRHYSLFTKLKGVNDSILEANCHAHVINDCAKVGLDELPVDVEIIVLKIYGHFSMPVERSESLKEFCEFIDVEFKEILATTRWLLLAPCIEKLLQNWNEIKEYFLSLQNECPKQIKKYLNINDDNQMLDDKVEIYLLFCHHVFQVFQSTIQKLEQDDTTCVELWSIMCDFKSKLTSYVEDQFFGSETLCKMEELLPEEKQKLIQDFTSFYNICLSYVKERFDYDTNWLSTLAPLAFVNNLLPTYDNIYKIVDTLKLKSILEVDMDLLHEELTPMKENFNFTSENWEKNYNTSEKWQYLLKIGNYPNLFKIISYIFSIPASSAFMEKVFSAMEIKWCPERNRCTTNLLKNELLIYMNNNASCAEFYESALKNKNLLMAAKDKRKYTFKKLKCPSSV